MKRCGASVTRRALRIVVAAFAGLAATLGLASPASAAGPVLDIEGEWVCEHNGTWKVFWDIENASDFEIILTSVQTSIVAPFTPAFTLPKELEVFVDQSNHDYELVVVQVLPGTTTGDVVLTVDAHTKGDPTATTQKTETVHLGQSPCPVAAPVLDIEGEQVCVDTGSWKVFWDIENASDFEIILTSVQTSIVAPFTPAFTLPKELEVFVDQSNHDYELVVVQFLPGTTTGDVVLTVDAQKKEDPTATTQKTETVHLGQDQCPALLRAEFTPKCDGTSDLKLIKTLTEAATFLVNGSEVALAQNEPEKTVPIAKDTGTTTVAGKGASENSFAPIGEFAWSNPPGCPAPPPPSDGSSLAATGAGVGGVVGVGAAMIALGAGVIGLVFVLRRRRAATPIA